MANINLVIPDAQLQWVINALCGLAPAADPANQVRPAPSAALAKAALANWVKQQVVIYESQISVQALPVPDTTGLVT